MMVFCSQSTLGNYNFPWQLVIRGHLRAHFEAQNFLWGFCYVLDASGILRFPNFIAAPFHHLCLLLSLGYSPLEEPEPVPGSCSAIPGLPSPRHVLSLWVCLGGGPGVLVQEEALGRYRRLALVICQQNRCSGTWTRERGTPSHAYKPALAIKFKAHIHCIQEALSTCLSCSDWMSRTWGRKGERDLGWRCYWLRLQWWE